MIVDAKPEHGARRAARTGVRLVELPELAARRPIDVAEAFRDVPGLALLESARPGRNARWSFLTADPIRTVEVAADDDGTRGVGVFDPARAMLGRLDRDAAGPDAPPFLGGLVGYLGYDLGRRFERLPSLAADDQHLPVVRLGLYDWALAWDRRTGRAWLGGRAFGGDEARLEARCRWVQARLESAPRPGVVDIGDEGSGDALVFASGLTRDGYEQRVEAIRAAIAAGELYQANLTRRLEAAFAGDPWPLYRRLRTGDPALFAAYLALDAAASTPRATAWASGAAGPRALLSASPEPFLAIDTAGRVTADPIKGTRPRGATPAEDRRLARELLASGKDRAENVMIVDVLRNDLGRVCRPGSVRVPRLCRLERTAAVQHLVSTVTGTLAPGLDAFDLLAAAFPGGSITGAPKIRAIQLLEGLEPVRRGPYTGAIGWFGPDGAMATSILIRTFVADGRRLTLHVGGGITWRSEPAAEWDETVVKARGPLGAIGAREAGSESP